MTRTDYTPEEIAYSDRARAVTRAFIEKHGEVMGQQSVVVLTGGLKAECWTNAWTGGGTYVEGIVFDEHGQYGGTHAWTLDAFGSVVERTPGYEKVGRYFGVKIDRRGPLAAPSRAWTGYRVSILEASLMATGPAHVAALLRGEVAPGLSAVNRATRRARAKGGRPRG